MLEPSASYAEDHTEHLRIWGRPIVLEAVPLQRFDLDDEPEPAPGSER